MDFSDIFMKAFSGKGFPTYFLFQKTLEEFQGDTGLQFIFKRTYLFPDDHVRRPTLIYKSIQYVCSESKPRSGTGCLSSFTVGCRKGLLYVSKYQMLHNHEIQRQQKIVPKPEPYNIITDCTSEFMQLFPTLNFSSLSELEEKMEEFQSKTGSMYAKRHTCPWPKGDLEHQDVVYKKFSYECFHFGYNKERENVKSDRRSFKTGCKSNIFVTCRNNQLIISRFDMRHNHPVSGACNVYRPNRRLTPQQKWVVKDLLKKEHNEITIKQFIQDRFQVFMTTADVRNLKRKLQPRKSTKSPIGVVLKALGNDGYVELIKNEGGVSRVICFTSPALIKTFQRYPELLQIREIRGDGFQTYIFSVVDRSLVDINVMFAFVLDSSQFEIFTPILRSFKNLMRLKIQRIEVVFIDSVQSFSLEIQLEFPHAKVLFYQDLMLQRFKASLKEYSIFSFHKLRIFQLLCDAMSAPLEEVYEESLRGVLEISPEYYDGVVKPWLPFANQWANHCRQALLTFGIDHHDFESLRPLESIIRIEPDLDSCAKKLLDASHPEGSVYTDRIICEDELSGQPDDIQAVLRLLSEPVANLLMEHLKEEGQNPSSFVCEVAARRCNCSFNSNWRLPCIHLMYAARSAYIPLTSLLKNSRWVDRQNWSLENLESATHPIVAAEEVFPPSASSSSHLNVNSQLQNIQELMISSPARDGVRFAPGRTGESLVEGG